MGLRASMYAIARNVMRRSGTLAITTLGAKTTVPREGIPAAAIDQPHRPRSGPMSGVSHEHIQKPFQAAVVYGNSAGLGRGFTYRSMRGPGAGSPWNSRQ